MKNRTFDEQYERAKKAGEEATKSEPRAESARYDPRAKRIVVRLRNGEDFSFSPEWVPGLRGASPFDLANIEVAPSGAGLHWERLDEDLSVTALLQGVFGPADVAKNLLPISNEFFETLCAQIEISWSLRREASAVDRLAAENPNYSADLYDFFALLVESELNSTEQEEFELTPERTLAWLEKEGFEAVQKIVREQRDETPETTPIASVASQPGKSEGENQDEEQKSVQPSQPLGYLGLAQERTGLGVETIEKRMNVPAAILKFVQRQPANELPGVRREIVRRGTEIGIEEGEGEAALSYQLQRAAKGGTKKQVSASKSVIEQFRELIGQIPANIMSREEKEYWIKLCRADENL